MKRIALVVAVLVSIFILSAPVFAIHKTIPAETESVDEQGITIQSQSPRPDGPNLKMQALINLLIKKGLISSEELQREIDILKNK